jgi:hypothetical protein
MKEKEKLYKTIQSKQIFRMNTQYLRKNQIFVSNIIAFGIIFSLKRTIDHPILSNIDWVIW